MKDAAPFCVWEILVALGGILLIGITLVDGFYTVVLPRRVRRSLRVARAFYRVTWGPFAAVARTIRNGIRREDYLAIYGPLSLLTLLACWIVALILGFGLVQWSIGHVASFTEALYNSAGALFMISPEVQKNTVSAWLVTLEAGVGFGLLGLVVGYLPVLYQSYSGRELRISLLDARAGSPPSAGELLVRQSRNPKKLEKELAAWEEWMAELLEEQLSYPMLGYFRSQHPNQSWLAALVAMLDASALAFMASDGDLKRQAQLTFAMGRHAMVDLATVYRAEPQTSPEDRLRSEQVAELARSLERAESCLAVDRLSPERLSSLRRMYEDYAFSLGQHFLIALPGWMPATARTDNWLNAAQQHSGGKFAVSDPFRNRA